MHTGLSVWYWREQAALHSIDCLVPYSFGFFQTGMQIVLPEKFCSMHAESDAVTV